MRGIGSMLHELSGGSPNSACEVYGKKILKADFENDAIYLQFDDGTKAKIYDDGQSCCESRYMEADKTEVESLVGDVVTEISVKEFRNKDGDDDHEIAFLEIKTNNKVVSFSTHNEHNGYYGGFGLSIEVSNDQA